MPDYEALIDGKPRKIELTKTAQNSFTADVDGKPHKIELQTEKIDPERTFTIRIDDKAYKIEMPKIEREKIIPVRVEEATFKVEIKASNRKQAVTSFEPTPMESKRKTGAVRQVAAEGAITAPMTGKIVKVKVKKGDQVKANQALCIIEAMKMENEINATRAGTVREVNVAEGSSVSEGEVLFILT